MSLVLSLFPGIGMLDLAFEHEGFCVVQGPDVLWGGDIRRFHPPAGRFDGIIGGDLCQSHSSLAHLVRAKGLTPSFPDMSPEFERVVNEAQPAWFLRENVPAAPDIAPAGYAVHSFLLDHSHLDRGDGLGLPQMRKRRFWFGVKGDRTIDLREFLSYAVLLLPTRSMAVTHRNENIPVRQLKGGKLKKQFRTPATATDGRFGCRTGAIMGRHDGAVGSPTRDYSNRYTFEDMLELQGLPADFLAHSPFTVAAKKKMIGNGVPLQMGQALARAIRGAGLFES